MGLLPLFKGKSNDFDSYWYTKIGKMLSMTLLINIFSHFVSKLLMPLVKLIQRCLDRGCKISYSSVNSVYSNDNSVIYTKKELQEDLDKLYTSE